MKKLCLAVAASAALAIPAWGADLPTPASAPVYKAAPVFASGYDWSGVYFGGFASYSWATANSTTTNLATGLAFGPVRTTASAWHGGGQLGYDYMIPSRIVLGIVSDLSSGATHAITAADALGSTSTRQDQTIVSGTVRGRLGYAFDRVLVYGTGGWAWSEQNNQRTQLAGAVGGAVPGTVETAKSFLSGWTAGGGLSYAFADNWNVFAEYRYTRFVNTVRFPVALLSTNSTTNGNAVELGLNFKFGNPDGCYWNQKSC
jgi:opacity protein-like surface antigen